MACCGAEDEYTAKRHETNLLTAICSPQNNPRLVSVELAENLDYRFKRWN